MAPGLPTFLSVPLGDEYLRRDRDKAVAEDKLETSEMAKECKGCTLAKAALKRHWKMSEEFNLTCFPG